VQTTCTGWCWGRRSVRFDVQIRALCFEPGTALVYVCGIVAEGIASAESEVGDEGTLTGQTRDEKH
jgi:hypothetical protein